MFRVRLEWEKAIVVIGKVGADTLLGMLRVVRTSSCEAWSDKIYLRESEMNVRPGVRNPIRDQREKFLEK